MDYGKLKFEDLFWLIGWLEAEGSFSVDNRGKQAVLEGGSKDEDTIDRICHLLCCNKYSTKPRQANWSTFYRFRVCRASISELMHNIKPFFSVRRRVQIENALSRCDHGQFRDFGWHPDISCYYDIQWLSGYLEGEGSFMAGAPSSPNMCSIAAQTTDEDVAARVAALWAVKYHAIAPRKEEHKVSYIVTKRGSGAMAHMKVLRPHMSSRRQMQIDRALESYHVVTPTISTAKLTLQDVEEMKRLRAEGETVRALASKFSVSHPTVVRVCSGERYTSTRVRYPEQARLASATIPHESD